MHRQENTGFCVPLRLQVGPSYGLRRIVCCLYYAAVVPLLYSGLPVWLALPVLIAVVVHERYLASRVLSRRYELIENAGTGWLLACNDGEAEPVEVLPGSLVHPHLTVLRLKTGQGLHNLVLTRDNVCPDSFRRLRVRMRFPR